LIIKKNKLHLIKNETTLDIKIIYNTMDLILIFIKDNFLDTLILAIIVLSPLFRKFIFSYATEKGKNFATKQDIGNITEQVETIKSFHISDIERLKTDLLLISRKNDILFNEKIRVFKRMQTKLVELKRYCEATIGTYDKTGNFWAYLDLETLDKKYKKPISEYIKEIREIEEENFIFLTTKSKKILNDLYRDLSSIRNLEDTLINDPFGKNKDLEKNNSEEKSRIIVPKYETAVEHIKNCLYSLYEELEFPRK